MILNVSEQPANKLFQHSNIAPPRPPSALAWLASNMKKPSLILRLGLTPDLYWQSSDKQYIKNRKRCTSVMAWTSCGPHMDLTACSWLPCSKRSGMLEEKNHVGLVQQHWRLLQVRLKAFIWYHLTACRSYFHDCPCLDTPHALWTLMHVDMEYQA